MSRNNTITDVRGILVGHAQDEDALTGCVDGNDVTSVISRENGIFDVVDNCLQLRLRALFELASQCRCFIGHQLHRPHDPATLSVHGGVSRGDDREQSIEVQLTIRASGLLNLLVEQSVHAPFELKRALLRRTCPAQPSVS